jgi:hypothetical protein
MAEFDPSATDQLPRLEQANKLSRSLSHSLSWLRALASPNLQVYATCCQWCTDMVILAFSGEIMEGGQLDRIPPIGRAQVVPSLLVLPHHGPGSSMPREPRLDTGQHFHLNR